MRHTHLIIDEFQRMASEGFKLVLQQGRSFGLSIGLANQCESDLMTKSTNRLLDTIRANTQLKLYLSVNDPLTIKMLEKAAGVIPTSSPSGLRYEPRLTINDIRLYSSDPNYCICWITRDTGFAAYGGDWFGMRTRFHISAEEFTRRNNAPWPAPTASTIVATRTPEGKPALLQGPERALPNPVFGTDIEPAQPLAVPEHSTWAKRLREIFNRRFLQGGNENGN